MPMIENASWSLYGHKNFIESKQPIAITFGNFDGAHLGHKYLIQHLRQMCPQHPCIVVTFDPHPATFFKPSEPIPLLTNLQDKIHFLIKYGADCVVVQKFTQEFASLDADAFCDHWLKTHFHIHAIMLGYDSRYGKNRLGNFDHLKSYEKKYGWHVQNLSALESANHDVISSSAIRQFLQDGNVEKAEVCLGRPYSLSGKVVLGDQMGRKIGFPTANLNLDCNFVIPKHGVYTCYVEIKGTKKQMLPSVMNCGVRPTVSGNKLQIEAHILDFCDDIYGKEVSFHIKKYLRPEMKFSGLEELKKQIQLDVDSGRNFFKG